MMTFKEFASWKQVDLFVGRFQPFHIGHLKIVEQMQNPLICVVRGEKSSQDQELNPLTELLQHRLIEASCPNANVMFWHNGFVPQIYTELKKEGFAVRRIFCGEDRIQNYKKLLVGEDIVFPISFVTTQRYCSATRVRQLIRDGLHEQALQLLPPSSHHLFNKLVETINK